MSLECPTCRERVSFLRTIRTTAWGRFRCPACGSILGIDFKRRMLALIPWVGIILFLLHIVRVQDYGLHVVISTFALAFVVVFYLFDRVALIERRAFCCKKCGYDLRGQVEHRCPECGTPFDPGEKARILARIGSPPPKAKHRWIVVVLILLLALTLMANILTYRAGRAGPGPGPTTRPSAPAAGAPQDDAAASRSESSVRR